MKKNHLRRKHLVTGIDITFIILFVLGSLSNVTGSRMTQLQSNPTYLTFNQYIVFGIGDGWWIDPFNSTWHGNLHERNDNYTHQTYGLYYKTNIYIVNQCGMQIGRYGLFIKDRLTRTMYNKTELPYRFIIYKFTGTIALTFYGYPHGAHGCLFSFIGIAEDFKEYIPKDILIRESHSFKK